MHKPRKRFYISDQTSRLSRVKIEETLDSFYLLGKISLVEKLEIEPRNTTKEINKH